MRWRWLAGFGLAAGLFGAAPPWTQPYLALPADRPGKVAVLLESWDVTYLSSDEDTSRVRWLARLTDAEGMGAMGHGVRYDALDTQVLTADAWVIQPNGRAHHYSERDFADVAADPRSNFWTKLRAVIFFPAGRMMPGDTLAIEVRLQQKGVLEVDAHFPPRANVMHEYFRVVPPPGTALTWHASSPEAPSPTIDSATGAATWQSEPAPLPQENRRPSGFLPDPEWVQIRPARSDLATWPAVTALAASLVEPRIVISPQVRAKALELVAGKASRWERIRALTEFVQEDIVYLSLLDGTDALAGCRPHLPEDVLSNRFGDCKDKAAFLVALLRATGDDGRVLLVKAGDPNAVDPQWASMIFDHAIVAIAGHDAPSGWPRIDGGLLGSMVVFDPTDSATPLGVLPESDQGGWALLVDSRAGKLVRLPQPVGENVKSTSVEAELDGQGELTVHSHRVFRGSNAAGVYEMEKSNPPERVALTWKDAARAFTGLPEDLTWQGKWDRPSAEYRLDLTYHSRAGHYLSDALMALGPQFAQGSPTFAQWQSADRGVAWITDQTYRCHSHVRLPAGWTVEELPADWIRTGSTVNASIHYTVENGFLTYDSRLSIKPGFYPRATYEKIRRFMERVAEAERRPVILRRQPAPPPAAAAHS